MLLNKIVFALIGFLAIIARAFKKGKETKQNEINGTIIEDVKTARQIEDENNGLTRAELIAKLRKYNTKK